MNSFTSPRQMKAELANVISDAAMLERVVADYFRDREPAPLPKRAPVSGYRPLSYKEPAKAAEVRELETFHDMMENGSRMLHAAIEDMRKGIVPRTPAKLMWSHPSGEEMRQHNGMNVRDFGEYEYSPPKLAPRGPCFKCGAAKGCKHLGGV